MKAKVVIVLCSSDEEAIKTGVVYGTNAMTRGWFEEVKFIFMGAAEDIILKNNDLLDLLSAFKPLACKFIAEERGIDKKLAEKGMDVVYVGEPLANYINEGWVPLVF